MKQLWWIGIVFIVLDFAACSRELEPVTRTQFALGTSCSATLYDGKTDELFSGIFSRVVEVERKMSVTLSDSEIASVNAMAGKEAVVVSDETFGVVAKGKLYGELTSGRFDIAIGPLVKLWGIGTDHAKVPAPGLLSGALSRIDYRRVVLNEPLRSVFLADQGMALDLGGIAKGWAAEKSARYLRDQGVRHAILNFGGNIYAYGTKPDGSAWRIGVQNPEEPRGEYIGILEVRDKAVVTSGKYERFFMDGDKRYHHILDTKSGFPVENGVASVTIVASDSTDADALSTAVFALGIEQGLAFASGRPEIEALIISEGKKLYLTEGLRGAFKLTDPSFEIAGD
jgi:thiamine biosynthesis lipoprotein